MEGSGEGGSPKSECHHDSSGEEQEGVRERERKLHHTFRISRGKGAASHITGCQHEESIRERCGLRVWCCEIRG